MNLEAKADVSANDDDGMDVSDDDSSDDNDDEVAATDSSGKATARHSRRTSTADGDADQPGDVDIIMRMSTIEVFVYNMQNRRASRPKSINFDVHNKMLFALCAGVAGIAVVESKTMKKLEIYKAAAAKFDEVLTLWAKTTTAYEGLMQYLPGKVWPTEFVEVYIPHLKKKTSDGPFAREFKKDLDALRFLHPVAADLERELRCIYFGYLVYTSFQKSAQYVNNTCNRLYPDPLPSGVTKDAKLWEIRAALIQDALQERTEDSVRNAKRYAKNAKKGPDKMKELGTEEAFEKRLKVVHDKFNLRWYPTAWLCFVLLGRPSAQPHPKFNSMTLAAGRSSIKQPSKQHALQSESSSGTDSSVTRTVGLPKKLTVSTPLAEHGAGQSVNITHTHRTVYDEVEMLEKFIASCERMKMLGKDVDAKMREAIEKLYHLLAERVSDKIDD
jgi:hypothetical protein